MRASAISSALLAMTASRSILRCRRVVEKARQNVWFPPERFRRGSTVCGLPSPAKRERVASRSERRHEVGCCRLRSGVRAPRLRRIFQQRRGPHPTLADARATFSRAREKGRRAQSAFRPFSPFGTSATGAPSHECAFSARQPRRTFERSGALARAPLPATRKRRPMAAVLLPGRIADQPPAPTEIEPLPLERSRM